MTIALAAVSDSNLWMQGATLAVIALAMTALIYGSVALIVKADDLGLLMSNKGRLGVTRFLGEKIVKGMPTFLWVLATVGTAAMLWVGGSIILHGLKDLGAVGLPNWIHHAAESVGALVPAISGSLTWLTQATLDGLFGLVVGLLLIPVVTRGLAPLWGAVRGQ